MFLGRIINVKEYLVMQTRQLQPKDLFHLSAISEESRKSIAHFLENYVMLALARLVEWH